jgi:hypothetical protein
VLQAFLLLYSKILDMGKKLIAMTNTLAYYTPALLITTSKIFMTFFTGNKTVIFCINIGNGAATFSITTLSITTLSIMALSKMTLSIMTLSIMTFIITTLSITILSIATKFGIMTFSITINQTRHSL